MIEIHIRASRIARGSAASPSSRSSVSLIVTVIVLLGVLALFDFSNKLTRVQTNISDMQQSLRVAQTDSVRLIRMAGRGGLPLGNLPDGTAVAVANNVADGTHVGDAATPEVVPGSDVLTIRGVFASPIYQVKTADTTAFTLDSLPRPPTRRHGPHRRSRRRPASRRI